MKEERIFDIRGTLEKFYKPDEPEIGQEEAISKWYQEDYINSIKKNDFNSSDDEDNLEETQHYERIKRELLASLDRVKELESQCFAEDDRDFSRTKENKERKIKFKDGKTKINENEKYAQRQQDRER